MDNKIFRSKSIERISSPEQLNDYVRVSNPGIWMTLVAIIVLLVGACVWGAFGKMDTAVSVAISVKDGRAACYVKEKDIENVKTGQTALIKDSEYIIEGISDSPALVSEATDTYVMHTGSLAVGDWVYEVTFNVSLPDGVYEGKIITQSVSPISFLLN